MASARKIGVLTFHRCINYGSYWQARCLVEALRALGKDAVLLDHDSLDVNRAEWRCALQPLLPVKTPQSDLPFYATKTRRFLKAFENLPRSARFSLDDPATLEEFDVIVVGSDEVWNLRHPWYGGRPIFFGAGLQTDRLVSYAASFGNHDASGGLDEWWANKLRNFTAISVRDDNSARLISDALDIQPELVLDPCLLNPPAVSPDRKEAEQPYLAVYGHSFPEWFRQAVKRHAASLGCRLLSIGYRNDWADEQRIGAGPDAFARLIASAAGVVTNFFHGCVFALLNAKPFVCVGSDYRSNKLRDLTAAVGADRRLLAETDKQSLVGELLHEPLSADIFSRIAMLRRRSQAYLAAAVG